MENLFSYKFWNAVARKQREGQRKGQSVFNSALEFYPSEAGALRGSSCDPFYQDGKVSAFLRKLADNVIR